MGYHEDLYRFFKVADPKGYRNLKKTSKRSDNVLLDSGHYSTQAWGALSKCWKGFKIAKSELDMKKMLYYAKGIGKFQRKLGIRIMDFPEFGLVGHLVDQERKPDNNLISGSYRNGAGNARLLTTRASGRPLQNRRGTGFNKRTRAILPENTSRMARSWIGYVKSGT